MSIKIRKQRKLNKLAVNVLFNVLNVFTFSLFKTFLF